MTLDTYYNSLAKHALFSEEWKEEDIYDVETSCFVSLQAFFWDGVDWTAQPLPSKDDHSYLKICLKEDKSLVLEKIKQALKNCGLSAFIVSKTDIGWPGKFKERWDDIYILKRDYPLIQTQIKKRLKDLAKNALFCEEWKVADPPTETNQKGLNIFHHIYDGDSWNEIREEPEPALYRTKRICSKKPLILEKITKLLQKAKVHSFYVTIGDKGEYFLSKSMWHNIYISESDYKGKIVYLNFPQTVFPPLNDLEKKLEEKLPPLKMMELGKENIPENWLKEYQILIKEKSPPLIDIAEETSHPSREEIILFLAEKYNIINFC